MNTMLYKEYAAQIEYSNDDGCFIGHIAGIDDVVGFHGESVAELRAAFEEAVDDYLQTCEKLNRPPQEPYSGDLMLSDEIAKKLSEERETTDNCKQYPYDVALSYAGEQQEYAKQVAVCLDMKGIKPFFAGDVATQTTMWGKNVRETLHQAFSEGAEYVVPFISKEYLEKIYPMHELRSALDWALHNKPDKVLPACFKGVKVPPDLEGISRIDNIEAITPFLMAERISGKIRKVGETYKGPAVAYLGYIGSGDKIGKEVRLWSEPGALAYGANEVHRVSTMDGRIPVIVRDLRSWEEDGSIRTYFFVQLENGIEGWVILQNLLKYPTGIERYMKHPQSGFAH